MSDELADSIWELSPQTKHNRYIYYFRNQFKSEQHIYATKVVISHFGHKQKGKEREKEKGKGRKREEREREREEASRRTSHQ